MGFPVSGATGFPAAARSSSNAFRRRPTLSHRATQTSRGASLRLTNACKKFTLACNRRTDRRHHWPSHDFEEYVTERPLTSASQEQ